MRKLLLAALSAMAVLSAGAQDFKVVVNTDREPTAKANGGKATTRRTSMSSVTRSARTTTSGTGSLVR